MVRICQKLTVGLAQRVSLLATRRWTWIVVWGRDLGTAALPAISLSKQAVPYVCMKIIKLETREYQARTRRCRRALQYVRTASKVQPVVLRVPVDRSTRENIIILLASPNYLQYQYAGRSGGRPALLLCWPISCTEQTCIALQRHWDLSLAFIQLHCMVDEPL